MKNVVDDDHGVFLELAQLGLEEAGQVLQGVSNFTDLGLKAGLGAYQVALLIPLVQIFP